MPGKGALPLHHVLLGIPNPFVLDRVDSPWKSAIDVPDINRSAFEQCLRSLKLVRETHQSRGVILHGEPGTGKTHLLHRIRLYSQTDPLAWFVYLPPITSPDRFWRHVLERFFYDLCQRSKQSESPSAAQVSLPSLNSPETGPGQGPLTQIEEVLAKHLLNMPLELTQAVAKRWAEVCRQAAPGEALFKRLQPTMDRLSVERQLEPDVMKALRHYLAWHHRPVAYAFLLGRDLPEHELATLGIPRSLDDEQRARQAVLTFCRLAGPTFSIILAFDQLESLPLEPRDVQGWQAYARQAVDLLCDGSNLLIVSAVQTYFLPTFHHAVHTSHYHRLAQDESVVSLLSKDSAYRLIESRLLHCQELAQVRTQVPDRPPLWPLGQGAIERLIPVGGISARQLIRDCQRMFEKAQTPVEPVSPEDVSKPAETLDRYWSAQFEEALSQPDVRVDEGVYEDGLLKLLQAKPPQGWRTRRETERDLQAVLEKGDEKIGISVSTSENMTSVARHLKRLQDLVAKGKVSRLIFVRDARFPLTKTAVVAQQRLRELKEQGHGLILPSAEAYAALKALRRLWAEAAEETLNVGDHLVSLGELQQWLAEQTPRPLQELWDACQAVVGGPDTHTIDRVHEGLVGRWVRTLPDLAMDLGMPSQLLEQSISEHPEVAGLLSGPPAVVFLNPSAVNRR